MAHLTLRQQRMMFCKNITDQKNNRLGYLHNLLFFALTLLLACTNSQKELVILWNDGKAKAIQIPAKMVTGISKDAMSSVVKIRKANDTTDILGDYRFDGGLVFEPLIPFQRGADYIVLIENKNTVKFHIPADENPTAPEVIAVYPQLDTLPENLLKIYIQFSKPMRESESLKHIKLVKNNSDTLQDVFLDLQPELWNEDRTTITVWLDPGRIKRDLQPNLRMGAPLQVNEKYQLIVLKDWKDAAGLTMKTSFSKPFVTAVRDSLSPNPLKWNIHSPKALSKEALVITFGKALDHFLLMESFQVTDQKGIPIKGKWDVTDKDRSISFIPAEPWTAGIFTLKIASKLEDLAGNNLNRPFDRDMLKTKEPSTQEYYFRSFNIEK